jgi:hypothetical protein
MLSVIHKGYSSGSTAKLRKISKDQFLEELVKLLLDSAPLRVHWELMTDPIHSQRLLRNSAGAILAK